jgi:hypothetical protein
VQVLAQHLLLLLLLLLQLLQPAQQVAGHCCWCH